MKVLRIFFFCILISTNSYADFTNIPDRYPTLKSVFSLEMPMDIAIVLSACSAYRLRSYPEKPEGQMMRNLSDALLKEAELYFSPRSMSIFLERYSSYASDLSNLFAENQIQKDLLVQEAIQLRCGNLEPWKDQ